ncbi:hypothetical protein [Calothrix sp. NIES-2098]|uniref:hypothetical protein n=1 Tax=Calothrix sp. NIES-2098 TaxID=1954171 RepID=UPI000B604B50|nr:hypothetical protein NIES2098_25190 [Calothrix sp. NIES-2098]
MSLDTFLRIPAFQTLHFKKQNVLVKRTQNSVLNSDLQAVKTCREWIVSKTKNTFDKTRILGVVAAANQADSFLPYTIPQIIQQITEMGMQADIIIGLNHGFECPTVIEHFNLLPNVQITHLYTEAKPENNIAARIFDNVQCTGEPYCLSNIPPESSQHRIFIVHQKVSLHSSGKIRVLGDIYGSLLLKSIEKGWIPPEFLVTFDAETQFLVEPKYQAIESKLETNGLKLIVNELQKSPQIDILSTRNKFVVYQQAMLDNKEILLPDFSQEVPPIQLFLNVVHGKFSGYKWHPGGGIVARTDAMISLLAIISERYPGIRVEDVHLSILTYHAGFGSDICLKVNSTNRSPKIGEITMNSSIKSAWMEQIYRWMSGCKGLELCYGKHNIRPIVDDGFPWFTITKSLDFIRALIEQRKINLSTIIKNTNFLTLALIASRQLKRKSSNNPDILQGSTAKACW